MSLLRALLLLMLCGCAVSLTTPALAMKRPALTSAQQAERAPPLQKNIALRGGAQSLGPVTGKLVLGVDLVLGLLYIVQSSVQETQYLAGSIILFMLYLLWSKPELEIVQNRYQLFHNLVGMALFGENYNRRVIIDNLLKTRTFIINAIFVALYAYFGFA